MTDAAPALTEPDGGRVPISEAMYVFGDPEKVARYRAAKAAAAGKRRVVYFVMSDGEPINRNIDTSAIARDNRLINDCKKLWRGLIGDLLRGLISGQLIGSGYKLPLELSSSEQDITAHLWGFLTLRRRGHVAGGGLMFARVRVRCVTQKDYCPELVVNPTTRPAETATAVSSAKRRTRSNKVEPFEIELRRRASEGSLESTWRRQARVLFEWFGREHLKKPAPAEKTLRNQLKPLYDKLLRERLVQ